MRYIQTFTTIETITNATSARKWLLDTAGDVSRKLILLILLTVFIMFFNGESCVAGGDLKRFFATSGELGINIKTFHFANFVEISRGKTFCGLVNKCGMLSIPRKSHLSRSIDSGNRTN